MTKAREEKQRSSPGHNRVEEYAVRAAESVACTNYLWTPDTNGAAYSEHAARYTDVEQHESRSADAKERQVKYYNHGSKERTACTPLLYTYPTIKCSFMQTRNYTFNIDWKFRLLCFLFNQAFVFFHFFCNEMDFQNYKRIFIHHESFLMNQENFIRREPFPTNKKLLLIESKSQ